jgi:hypothetical protein
MKFLLLSLALLGLALCQSDDCDIRDEAWVKYRTSNTGGSEWEDYEVIRWGMDGGNKWNDWWLRPFTGETGESRYSRAVCSGTSQGDLPTAIPQMCGSCPLTSPTCDCYPYYDIANNYQDWPGNTLLESGSIDDRITYTVGHPPFEAGNPGNLLLEASTADNCKQYRPQYVYFYSQKLRLLNNGEFEWNEGISLGFTPSVEMWGEFCTNLYSGDGACWLPSPVGGSSSSALWGSHFSFSSGTFTLLENNEVNLITDRSYSGCHIKQSDRRFPSAVYCGDASGWRNGAGTTAHVRFGCDRETFFETDTDLAADIDDSDCNSVYVMFDEMNPLVNIAENYDSLGFTVLGSGSALRGTGCWRETSYRNYVTDMPNYRTPCSASGLAVPLLAVMSAVLLVVFRNF